MFSECLSSQLQCSIHSMHFLLFSVLLLNFLGKQTGGVLRRRKFEWWPLVSRRSTRKRKIVFKRPSPRAFFGGFWRKKPKGTNGIYVSASTTPNTAVRQTVVVKYV